MNEFREEMLRKFTPYFKYNAFSNEDVQEIKDVIDYARGLVIMDKKVADSLETNTSLKNASQYLKAINNTFSSTEGITEFERNLIIENYKETNNYYIYLYNTYNIPYYESRQASDFKILKTTINSLDKYHKSIFDEVYYESVNYFLKVIYTEAFSNQTYNREFYREYIIFMSIQRYITKIMENYFNIDTYDEKMLKNGFISYGLDYFDSFPLDYQRRTYKMLNTLIKNKGTNQAFNYILDIFSFNNVNIYKYPLVKTNNNELLFYKVPIDEILDIDNHLPVNFDYIVERDPYWRTEKEDIIDFDFNAIDSKYISVDILFDLLNNSMQLAYFFSLLNHCEILNNDEVRKYMEENSVTYAEALNKSGIQDVDFSFTNRNISSKQIRIFDAIIALIILVLKRMGYSDNINKNSDNKIKNVYAYNNLNTNNDGYSDLLNEIKSTNELLFELKKYIYWNKKNFTKIEYDEILNYLNNFKLKNFDYEIEMTFEDIKKEYNSSIICRNQLQSIAEYIQYLIGSDVIINKLEEDKVYDAFHALYSLLIKKRIDLSLLGSYSDFRKLFSKFLTLKLINGETNEEEYINYALNNDKILEELKSYVYKLNGETVLNAYEIFNKYPTKDNFLFLIEKIYENISKLREEEKLTSDLYIENYLNLNSYLDLFLSESLYRKTKFSMEDFAKIFKFNENIRENLEVFINETKDYFMYKRYKQIWDNKFTGNLDLKIFKDFNTYSDYLKENDQDLYFYVQIDSSSSNYTNKEPREIYQEKIFELVESIDNHLNLGEYDFLLENNFIGLSDYVKLYIYILIKVFKAYTTDTIFANTIWKFNDKTFNSIRMFDVMNILDTNLTFKDYIHIVDTQNMKTNLKLEDNIDLTDEIKITTFE